MGMKCLSIEGTTGSENSIEFQKERSLGLPWFEIDLQKQDAESQEWDKGILNFQVTSNVADLGTSYNFAYILLLFQNVSCV